MALGFGIGASGGGKRAGLEAPPELLAPPSPKASDLGGPGCRRARGSSLGRPREATRALPSRGSRARAPRQRPFAWTDRQGADPSPRNQWIRCPRQKALSGTPPFPSPGEGRGSGKGAGGAADVQSATAGASVGCQLGAARPPACCARPAKNSLACVEGQPHLRNPGSRHRPLFLWKENPPGEQRRLRAGSAGLLRNGWQKCRATRPHRHPAADD